MKKSILLIADLLSPEVFADCHHHYERYEKKLKEAQDAAKPVAVATGAASFFGPIATLVVSAVGAGTLAAMQADADRQLKKYNECIDEIKEEKKRVEEENRRKAAEAAEATRKREEAEKQRKKEELEKATAQMADEL